MLHRKIIPQNHNFPFVSKVLQKIKELNSVPAPLKAEIDNGLVVVCSNPRNSPSDQRFNRTWTATSQFYLPCSSLQKLFKVLPLHKRYISLKTKYNLTFWLYISRNRSGNRLFLYCNQSLKGSYWLSLVWKC